MKPLRMALLAACGAAMVGVGPTARADTGGVKPQAAGGLSDSSSADNATSYNYMPRNMGYENKLTVNAGAGLSTFTGSLGDHSNPGASWNARGTYDLTPNVGVEGSYVGASNVIDDQRLANQQSITTTAFAADVKLGIPLLLKQNNMLVKPFVYGGLGGAYYGVSGDNPLYRSDSDFQIPLGLGADAFITHNISLGARMDWMINIANRVGNDVAGNQLNFTANLGAHY
jgi:hypothetical protein